VNTVYQAVIAALTAWNHAWNPAALSAVYADGGPLSGASICDVAYRPTGNWNVAAGGQALVGHQTVTASSANCVSQPLVRKLPDFS